MQGFTGKPYRVDGHQQSYGFYLGTEDEFTELTWDDYNALAGRRGSQKLSAENWREAMTDADREKLAHAAT